MQPQRASTPECSRWHYLSLASILLVAMSLLMEMPASSIAVVINVPHSYFFAASPGATLATCISVCNTTRLDAYPATILNAQQNAKMFSVLPSGKRGILGGTRFVGDNTMFRWVTGPLGLEDGGLGSPFYNGTSYSTGNCISGAYCNWNTIQPDNFNGGEGVVETRFAINGKWNDIPEPFAANDGCFCQYDGTNTWSPSTAYSISVASRTPSHTDAPSRSITSNNTTTPSIGQPSGTAGRGFEVWYIPLYGQVFLQCIDLCVRSRTGGYLATPRNAEENENLRRAIPVANAEVFIGGSRNVGDRLQYRWVTGPLGREDNGLGAVFYDSYLDNGSCVSPYYCNFNVGEPNNYSLGPQALTGEYWVVLFQSSGVWNDDYIGDGCLCQRPLSTMVPTVSLYFSSSESTTIAASASRTRSLSASAEATKSLTPPPTPTSTWIATPSLTLSLVTHNVTASPTITLSPTTTATPTLSTTPTSSESRTVTRSILQSETLRDPGVVMVNQTLRGVFLSAPGPSGLWNESYVIAELQLVGTEFSPFFNRATVNCFANVSDALVAMPMDGVAADAVRALVARSTVVRVTSDTRAQVYFQADYNVYGLLARQTVVGIGLQGSCLARSYLRIHGQLTIEATIGDPATSTILANTGAVTTAVGLINPVVAVQAQRNSLALSIQFCEADDGSIGILRSPTTLALGNSTVAAYVGGAAMNHVVVFGMFIIMAFIAWVRLLGVGGTLMDALSTIRCPGPVAFPILLLIEPTATCAIITVLFAEGKLIAIGVVSLALCVSYPIVMLAYLLRGFKAERRQSIDAVMDDAGGNRVEKFMFGRGKWIDNPTIPGSKGFCRRNGYFFKEYREGRHWFLGVEVVLSVAIGSLEGIKLGYGQCQGVLYAMTGVLVTYMLAFFVLRPCVSPFANLYVLALTSMQVAGCVLLCFPHDNNRTAIAVELSAAGSYLVLLKSAVDVGELLIESTRSCKKYRDHREERRLAVAHAHSIVESIKNVEVPAALLKQPISILARRSRELGASYPAVVESGVLGLLDGGMYGRRGDVQAALEAVCVNNVVSMKRMAAHKEALDGVWRDWREEAMQVPVELVALAVQLREVESTMRASEASRVTLREASSMSAKDIDVASKQKHKGVDMAEYAGEEMVMLEDYLDPMLAEDADDERYSEISVELEDLSNDRPATTTTTNFVIPAELPIATARRAIYGINADGYLIVEDDYEELARDEKYFPEIEFH